MFHPGDIVRLRRMDEVGTFFLGTQDAQSVFLRTYGDEKFVVDKVIPTVLSSGHAVEIIYSDDRRINGMLGDRFVLVRGRIRNLDGLKELIDV